MASLGIKTQTVIKSESEKIIISDDEEEEEEEEDDVCVHSAIPTVILANHILGTIHWKSRTIRSYHYHQCKPKA